MLPPSKPSPSRAKASLTVEVGSWFKASATGAGILAVPVVVLLLIAAAVLPRILS